MTVPFGCVFVLLILPFFTFSITREECLQDFIDSSWFSTDNQVGVYQNKCWLYSTTKLSQENAEAWCVEKGGGHLALPESEMENDALGLFFTPFGAGESFWIGLYFDTTDLDNPYRFYDPTKHQLRYAQSNFNQPYEDLRENYWGIRFIPDDREYTKTPITDPNDHPNRWTHSYRSDLYNFACEYINDEEYTPTINPENLPENNGENEFQGEHEEAQQIFDLILKLEDDLEKEASYHQQVIIDAKNARDAAIEDYESKFPEYKKTIDYMNQEMNVLRQIYELLGESNADQNPRGVEYFAQFSVHPYQPLLCETSQERRRR